MKNNVDQDQWQILGEHDGTDDRYYAHDHLYSPAAMLDDTGAVVERYEYDAYGKAAILTPDSWLPTSPQYANPFTFTGRQLDILDGGSLHHMHYRHRDYSPQLGRFMQHDPLGINPVNEWPNFFGSAFQYYDSRNLYEYVSSRPLRAIDPFGLMDFPIYQTPIMYPYRAQDLWIQRCEDVAREVKSRVQGQDKFKRHCEANCEVTKEMGRLCAWLSAWYYEIGEGEMRDWRQDAFNNRIGRNCAKDVDKCGNKKFKSCAECCESNRDNQWKEKR